MLSPKNLVLVAQTTTDSMNLEQPRVCGVDDPLSRHRNPSDAIEGRLAGFRLWDVPAVHQATAIGAAVPRKLDVKDLEKEIKRKC